MVSSKCWTSDQKVATKAWKKQKNLRNVKDKAVNQDWAIGIFRPSDRTEERQDPVEDV